MIRLFLNLSIILVSTALMGAYIGYLNLFLILLVVIPALILKDAVRSLNKKKKICQK